MYLKPSRLRVLMTHSDPGRNSYLVIMKIGTNDETQHDLETISEQTRRRDHFSLK